MARILVALVILVLLGGAGLVLFVVLGGGFQSMDSCRRFDSAGTCGPICEQALGADDVSNDDRERACETAAEDLEADGATERAIAMLEVCQSFGRCGDDALTALRCRSSPAECDARCESGDREACLALVDSGADREPIGDLDTVRAFCALETERCDVAADRFCEHPSSPCGRGCLARENTLADLCDAAADQAHRRARMLRGIASSNAMEDELADDGSDERRRAAAVERSEAEYRAAACRLRPDCEPLPEEATDGAEAAERQGTPASPVSP